MLLENKLTKMDQSFKLYLLENKWLSKYCQILRKVQFKEIKQKIPDYSSIKGGIWVFHDIQCEN